MTRTFASLEARLGRVRQRKAEIDDRPHIIVYAEDADIAIAQARTAMPGRRIVYALPDNGRGDGPTVWGQR